MVLREGEKNESTRENSLYSTNFGNASLIHLANEDSSGVPLPNIQEGNPGTQCPNFGDLLWKHQYSFPPWSWRQKSQIDIRAEDTVRLKSVTAPHLGTLFQRPPSHFPDSDYCQEWPSMYTIGAIPSCLACEQQLFPHLGQQGSYP